MLLEEIINPDAVLCNAHARSKKHCLEILSELLVRSSPDISADEIFDNLIERERLGCTGLDTGVAFPHCRVDGLDHSVAAMIRLTEAVDFDAADGEPVDLIFGLMVPSRLEDNHVEDISLIASLLSDAGLRSRLRDASTSSDLYASLLSGGNLSTPSQSANAQEN
jgi:PTS system nitrogen regulatory IIA component